RRLVDPAFDLFLGKPALLVAHHQDFRDGGGELEKFVDGLHALAPDLSWPALCRLLTESCLARAHAPGLVDVRFYTRRFRVTNPGPDPRRSRLRRDEPIPDAVRAVQFGGTTIPFRLSEGTLEAEVDLGPGESGVLDIVDHPTPDPGHGHSSWLYQLGVLTRR